MMYERLKNGRMQKELKDTCTDRYGYSNNPNVLSYLKKIKGESASNRGTEGDWNKKSLKNDSSKKTEKDTAKTGNKEDPKTAKNEGEKGEDKKEGEGEDMDQRAPLLIIDVNIRAGEKKKLYVHEGDTAEELAEEFARQNSKS